MTPLQRYQRDLSDPAFAADPVQAETVRLLQSLYEQLCLEHRLQRNWRHRLARPVPIVNAVS